MFMRFIALATLLLATSLCGAQETVAPGVNKAVVEPPIIIDSDSNQYDLRSGLTRFSDNVRIQRGAMEVIADEGVVHQADGRYTLIELSGSPTRWRDRLDDGSIVEGRARQIQYDVIENVVTLTGDARLTHEQGEFTGNELVYDLDTESLAGRGSSENQARVILEGDSLGRDALDGEPEPAPEAEADSASEGEADSASGSKDEATGQGQAAAQTEVDATDAETETDVPETDAREAAAASEEGLEDAPETDPQDETAPAASKQRDADDEEQPVDPPAVR